MTKGSTATQAAVHEKLQQLKAGAMDAKLGLTSLARWQDEASTKERLTRFCLVAAREALIVLRDWYEGIPLAAALTVTQENWAKQHVMSKPALNAARDCLWGLHLLHEPAAEAALRQLDAKDLEQVALALGVLMADFTMALEEQSKISQSHATPTLL